MYLHVHSFPSFHSAVIVQKQNKMETWNIVSFYQSNSEIWYFVHRCWRTWCPRSRYMLLTLVWIKIPLKSCTPHVPYEISENLLKKTIYLKQPLHAYGFICKKGYLNRLFSVNFRYLKWNFVCIWLKRNFHHKVNHSKGLNREKEGVGFVLSSNICEFTCFKNAYVEPKSIVSNLFLIMVITHHEVYLK